MRKWKRTFCVTKLKTLDRICGNSQNQERIRTALMKIIFSMRKTRNNSRIIRKEQSLKAEGKLP